MAVITTALVAAGATSAQPFEISWWSIDGGGGVSSGATFEVRGVIGQPDAGVMTGGTFTLHGGFLAGAGVVQECYADCDQSTGPGVLDIFDFLCFGNEFASGTPYACDCDVSTGPGVCDIFDFLCFGNAFSAGCP